MLKIDKNLLPSDVSFDKKERLFAELDPQGHVRSVQLYNDESHLQCRLDVLDNRVVFSETFVAESGSETAEAEEFLTNTFVLHLEKINDRRKFIYRCSFCGKTRDEVKNIINGPVSAICDECVSLCNDIIADSKENE